MQNYLDGIHHTYFKNQSDNKNNKPFFPSNTLYPQKSETNGSMHQSVTQYIYTHDIGK
jgi:hypothetical protein